MVEYTIDDIRGPTVAREMAQLKEFVLAKFNGAIADAEAAAAQAATDAANAVLSSIDSRVGALEGDMTTAQGDIVANANAILALDGSVVKLAGAQTITGIKNVPLEATGTASSQIASSQKVKNELDNYAPMVRTANAQTVGGEKTFTSKIKRSSVLYNGAVEHQITNMLISDVPASGTFLTIPEFTVLDSNGSTIMSIAYSRATTYTALNIRIDDSQSRSTSISIRANEDGTSAIYLIGPGGTRQVATI